MTEDVKPKRRGRKARQAARAAEVTPRLKTIRYGIKPIIACLHLKGELIPRSI